ncbi:MAG: glycosyltransferase [Ignavibacteriaceae bacterium]|nr:glycosyltransferase [Ignavibacteriaceae bacterium]
MELYSSFYPIIELIVFVAAFSGAIFYALFMEYILVGIKRLRVQKHPVLVPARTVSVIVPVRNEFENISELINSLSEIDYPDDLLEIVIVDDESTDGSSELLSNLISGKMKIMRIHRESGNYSVGKKGAIEYGIEHSSGEIILVTDADCKVSKSWVKSIVTRFRGNTGVVSGPLFIETPSGFIRNIFLLEQAGILIAAAGLIENGTPVTCSGANLAYLRKAFQEVEGYQGFNNVASGDDDLLMQKIHSTGIYRVAYAWDTNALVHTKTAGSSAEFLKQRSRWASKILLYKNRLTLIVLSLIFLFMVSFTLMTTWVIVKPEFLMILIAAYLLKMNYDYRVLLAGKRLFFKDFKFLLFLAGSFIHPFYLIFSTISGQLTSVKWKGRDFGNPHSKKS